MKLPFGSSKTTFILWNLKLSSVQHILLNAAIIQQDHAIIRQNFTFPNYKWWQTHNNRMNFHACMSTILPRIQHNKQEPFYMTSKVNKTPILTLLLPLLDFEKCRNCDVNILYAIILSNIQKQMHIDQRIKVESGTWAINTFWIKMVILERNSFGAHWYTFHLIWRQCVSLWILLSLGP
jgi:hypothetical protein